MRLAVGYCTFGLKEENPTAGKEQAQAPNKQEEEEAGQSA